MNADAGPRVGDEPQVPLNGKLAENVLHFGRALRAAGLPVGPGAVLDALAAIEAAGVGSRDEFRDVLRAIFVKRREHLGLFDQAFAIFWRRKGFIDKLLAMMSPEAKSAESKGRKAEAGATRVADAFFQNQKLDERATPSLDLDARLTMSSAEILSSRDFAQMTAAEVAEAERRIAALVLPDDLVKTRRHAVATSGARFDPRASFRRMLRDGSIDFVRKAPRRRHPPIVALIDISGSMSEYSRIFLHFAHALARRRRVSTFLFGTRLTNVTRSLQRRDPDEALALCGRAAQDWSGGTRIAENLHRFNREWSRRALGQGAVVLLFTDGLERDGVASLEREAERLHMSCRRLIWLNPLLRFEGFSAKAQGVRAILPHVDELRPVHNLSSMASLCAALGRSEASAPYAPRRWIAAA